ncbi:unnamed protein product [Pleuronectes platessa]|uniref:Uncharacterized protein n=1 Tax=Pleuronectes platessa TaxID=8262 RepID=A0A9N7U5A0_PLEPL|nr:unnamed protein product [Pleuronectes platessa]
MNENEAARLSGVAGRGQMKYRKIPENIRWSRLSSENTKQTIERFVPRRLPSLKSIERVHSASVAIVRGQCLHPRGCVHLRAALGRWAHLKTPLSSDFLCLKNIRTFLKVCHDKFGLRHSELFDPFDLFDVRDFGKPAEDLGVGSAVKKAESLAGVSSELRGGYAKNSRLCSASTPRAANIWNVPQPQPGRDAVY